MIWQPLDLDKPPRGDVLLWSGNKVRHGALVETDSPEPIFMDTISACLIKGVTHWMPLPEPPPERPGGNAAGA